MSEQSNNSVETKPVPTRAVCKFTLRSLKDYGNDNKEVELCTRYDSALPEDQKFSKFTPSGEMKFALQNPALDGFFKPGETYLITIEPAPDKRA